MKRFRVTVPVRYTDIVTVDAPDAEVAGAIAADMVLGRLEELPRYSNGLMLFANDMDHTDPITIDEEQDPARRSATQVCTHCGTSSEKGRWGPGWMTCPACGKRPMSAGEVYGVLRLLADACDPANPKVTLDAIATAERAGYVEAVKAARALLAEREIVAP